MFIMIIHVYCIYKQILVYFIFIFQCKKSLTAAKDEFTLQNNALKEDIPKFIDMRTEYIQPSLESLIRSQVYLTISKNRIFDQITGIFDNI